MAEKNNGMYDGGVKEAFQGLYVGIAMMLITFTILHFVFDIKMFQ